MNLETQEILRDMEFESIDEYLESLSEEHDVDIDLVNTIFMMLGEEELFDAIPITVQDASNFYE